MKHIGRYLFIVPLLSFWIPVAAAQNTAEFNIGFGTNHVKPNGSGIDDSTGNTCTSPGFGTCDATPSLNGFFLGLGGDVMLSKHFGVGGEISFLPSKGNYGPLLFRQTFFDLNGISEPFHASKRIVPRFMGGIGMARTGFSYTASQCVGTAVCSTSTQSFGSSNHFQIHAGAGIEILLTEHLFIRPQFDFRYVPNFTDQFGSNLVYGGMFWIGFKSSR